MKQETPMSNEDITPADILDDPLIRLMMRADRVSLGDMKKLLREVSEMQDRTQGPQRVQRARKD
jgi:hypothetical protein